MPGAVAEENSPFDDIYKEIGEFGLYQFCLFLLIGSVSFIPSVVAYGYRYFKSLFSSFC
jgi:hypothetical protein